MQTGWHTESRITAGLRRGQTSLEWGLCILSGSFHKNKGADHIEMFPYLIYSWPLIEVALSGWLR